MFIRTPLMPLILLAATSITHTLRADCPEPQAAGPDCTQLEAITIFGSASSARKVTGGASAVTHEELETFATTDVVRALRRVPGVALQLEDGWGLRPNISIRGTTTERSSRITLMEDGVLITPAPYSAPAAYYFPTFGRINSVEVLKGPAAITEGPYTVGGAVNLRSSPIPAQRSGLLRTEYGSDDTRRVHGWYGGSTDRTGFIIETHQWRSDGFQSVDRNPDKTGLDKRDYLAKLALYSDPGASLDQMLEIKLETSEETSQQSYLGLRDDDFSHDGLRRYGLSALDEMQNDHQQIALSWQIQNQAGSRLLLTAYHNDFYRDWYKTEAFDADGSEDPASFAGASWSNVIAATNQGQAISDLSAEALQSILEGADTLPGSVQIRSNARDYFSRGIQVVADQAVQSGDVSHLFKAGIRYHEDEEDRLQRNDNFQQLQGQLVLNQTGIRGNAGNQVQGAQAWAAFVQDRIETGRWTLTPGLRYENILLQRTRYLTNSPDPSRRTPDNFRDYRENRIDIWLPGMGAIYELSSTTRLVGGIHRGFAVPGNQPGVDPEESTNYELGLRHELNHFHFEAMVFFNDYQNLVGVCTNSSGSGCEPGESFNGNGVDVPGLELSLQTRFEPGAEWQVPVQLAYTWMNAKFRSSFDSDFFGEVEKGDPVPYVPDNQLWASVGLLHGPWSFNLSANYVSSVCTRASCGNFEQAEAATIFDWSAHYTLNAHWELYGLLENLTDKLYIAAREPYGARPNKPQTFTAGARFSF